MYASLHAPVPIGYRPGFELGCYDCGADPCRRPGPWNPTRTGMGATPPADVADSIMPQSAVSNVPGFTQDVWNDIEQSAQTGQISGFVQSCSTASGPSGAQITSMATSGGTTVALLIPAVASGPFAPFILAGAALVGLFAQLFQHHAQAVKKEQATECAAVPAFNDGSLAIQGAVTSGTLTPQQGISALSQLLSEFQAQISSIMTDNAQNCNAGCVWWKCAQAAVASLQSQYQDLINAASASAAASAGTTIDPTTGEVIAAPAAAPGTSWFSQETIFGGVPNWGVAAAAVLLAFVFFGGSK